AGLLRGARLRLGDVEGRRGGRPRDGARPGAAALPRRLRRRRDEAEAHDPDGVHQRRLREVLRRMSMAKLMNIPVAGALILAACVGQSPSQMQDPNNNTTAPAGGDQLTASGPDNTFDHQLDTRDPFDILSQKEQEGSPLVATRLHSCQKMS